MSKGQKKLSDYITEHYDKAVYLTAHRLGAEVGVSESTVVRFATELGYEGYPELQDALQDMVRARLTSVQRIEVAKGRIRQDNLVSEVLQADIENIKATMEKIDEKEFRIAVRMLREARTVYILGVRSSASLASFFGNYLNLILDSVKLIHTNSVSETFEQMLRVGAEDVVVGISFPRYSRRTLRAMEYAKAQGAKLIAITDGDQSPLRPLANITLEARSDMLSFVDSLAAPLSLINAILVALSLEQQDKMTRSLEQLEHIWREYDVYEDLGTDEDRGTRTILS
jgi:DNA-binding MurR/RpiR family transcriptional regulator